MQKPEGESAFSPRKKRVTHQFRKYTTMGDIAKIDQEKSRLWAMVYRGSFAANLRVALFELLKAIGCLQICSIDFAKE
jgi:hypothetical protein